MNQHVTESQMTVQLTAEIGDVRGFRVAGVHCGLKKNERLDLALILSDAPCTAAGVFTTNQVKAAPVLLGMERLTSHADDIRAVVVNTGSANAVTGELGMQNAHATTHLVAQACGIQPEQVIPLSTGVIGLQLRMEKIERGVTLAAGVLGADWDSTARAIMTTDTRPKSAMVTVQTANGEYRIAGIAKGAGMIAPNMATMLSVIVTDAALSPVQVQQTVKSSTSTTFNRIVVDGDMSTNDTVLLLANGQSGVTITDAELPIFEAALTRLCKALAQGIVRDGEGVTKFITVYVCGAPDDAAAYQVAHTIATSPLVKTAFYGNDANWGRLLAAAGRAGVPVDQTRVNLFIAPGVDALNTGLQLLQQGAPTAYAEADAHAIMLSSEITATLDLNNGTGAALVWTTDFSHDYVSINADYRS